MVAIIQFFWLYECIGLYVHHVCVIFVCVCCAIVRVIESWDVCKRESGELGAKFQI